MKFRSLNGRQIDFMRSLRDAGATAPEAAFTLDRSSPAISPEELEELVEVEAISRVAPYRYYLRAESRHAKLLAALDKNDVPAERESAASVPYSWARLGKTMLFWILVILIPILLLQLTRR